MLLTKQCATTSPYFFPPLSLHHFPICTPKTCHKKQLPHSKDGKRRRREGDLKRSMKQVMSVFILRREGGSWRSLQYSQVQVDNSRKHTVHHNQLRSSPHIVNTAM